MLKLNNIQHEAEVGISHRLSAGSGAQGTRHLARVTASERNASGAGRTAALFASLSANKHTLLVNHIF